MKRNPIHTRLLAVLLTLPALGLPWSAAQAGGGGNGAAPFTAIPADTATSASFTSSPIVSIQSATPFAMVAMSRDQSLDRKAYDDYTDLNGDGAADIGYEDTGIFSNTTPGTAGIAYYGYFDAELCYVYNGTNFVPQEAADSNFHCNLNGSTNEWSGNFLNWATMTRMDELRKILFGGYRSTDGTGASGITILRRQFLPSDGHSFAKYYNGDDINQLMPFNLASTKYGSTCVSVSGRRCGVTLCNTTAVPLGNSTFSEDIDQVANPPVVRAAFGNYQLWNGSERWQCRWGEELQGLSSGNNTGSGATNQGSNGNFTGSGVVAFPYSPFQNGTSGGSSPSNAIASKLLSTDGYGPDFGVLVQVCVATLNTAEENCKQYPNGNLKPIGLLQLYGDDNEMFFGMMAGDYSSNKEGGTLTKNIGTMNDEIANTSDGHFLTYFPTGTCSGNSCAGIINAISLYTTAGYSYTDGTYNNSDGSIGSCSWGLNTFASGRCVNWGNPFAEIYLNTVLYLGGQGVQGGFQANDSNVIPGLYTPLSSGYKDPLSATTRCTSLNVVAFNTGAISYDSNSLDGASSGQPGVKEIYGNTAAAETMTSAVGTDEGMAGQYFFGGTWNYTSNTFSGDGLCTPKTFTNLGAVNGVCPDAPRLQGSYNIAGLAFWVHTHDMRPDLAGNQLITTYAVALATGTPIMQIPLPGSSTRSVTLIPACQDSTVGGNCALVDFKIISQDLVGGTGSFYVDWEDSEQGGDYDQDEWGIISYVITAGQIQITTSVIASSTPYSLGFGFIVGGTTQDGAHFYSGINSYTYTDTYAGVPSCSGSACVTAAAPVSYTFTLGAGSAQAFKDPLWYAAKYGAFQDQNGNLIPDLPGEWNCYNHASGNKNTNCGGTETPDGIPDTYYKANNPRALYASLQRVFQNILAKTASGTAAAVVANARQGNGAIYQALYEPLHQDVHGNAVSWIGTMYSLFVDAYGNLREDGNHNATMDDYTTDPVVSIFFDPLNNVTEFRRYISCDPTKVLISSCASVVLPLFQLNTVWDARTQLENMTSLQVAAQATWTSTTARSTTADKARYIFTWLGARDPSSNVPVTVDFVPGTFTVNNLGYLNPDNSGGQTAAQELVQVQNIVSWVRGVEQTGMRSRTVDYYNNGKTEVERLGDIVNATPTVVGPPQEAFDVLYNDTSYATFRTQYVNRRTVVYVGSNDGMLHAFNGGFFDAANNSFTLSSLGGTGTEVQNPLGNELWAYVPMDLLPHLKWLTQTNYPHLYYVDAKPRVFDAKIFKADADHPGGWGTVLVEGMRFGGSPVCINTDGSSLTSCPNNGSSVVNPPSGNSKTTVFLQAAYIMMDITNPEHAPQLMDEFFVPSNLSTPSVTSVLGFTTSYPTASTFRKFTNTANACATTSDTTNTWYLVFGSGPTDLANAISNQDAQLFVYNLGTETCYTAEGNWASAGISGKIVQDYDLSGSPQSFTGDPVSADWDLNFLDNAMYFGTIGNTAASITGKLYRLGVDEDANFIADSAVPQVLLALPAGQGETPTPSVALDPQKNPWVYFGTGRFYVNADKTTAQAQGFYGIKDRNCSSKSATCSVTATITADSVTNLVDVSTAVVDINGNLTGVTTYAAATPAPFTYSSGTALPASANASTVSGLQQFEESSASGNPDGWSLNFPVSTVTTVVSPVPTSRNVSETAIIGGIFFGTAYSPDPDLCGASGQSSLYGVFYLTGTPKSTVQVFGQYTVSSKQYVLSSVSLGAGLASAPSLQVAKGLGNGQAEIYTQTSTGAIVQNIVSTNGGGVPTEISWQQPND